MSVSMLIAALAGPRLAAQRSPKRVAQLGLVGLAIGAVVLVGTIDYELARVEFAVGLAIFGVGAGLLASQLGNVIMSSVEPSMTNEAGGLQGTAQNLGSSFGTALIGAILLSGLASATAAGLSPAEAEAVASDYAAAQLVGLRDALGAVALVAVLRLWFTRRLPTGDPAADGRSASSRSAGRSNGVMAER